ncbi:MAG: filamentous hemagglutinin N-terminal domain-containing protein, partial [Chlamydiia bacterium]|nr:filamentous hemagglutinin N-terminal domain-containing protein [Chlamydiia bacterium]
MKILLPLLAIACLHAQPQHPVVIAGDVAMTSLETANALIYSKSERSIVEWESFSIGKGETLNLSLPSQNGAILNRVMGKEGSQILGKMLSNGKVYLINPQGIVIGSEGMIQAGSFVGSTLDCSNETFLTNAKEWVFSGQGEEITNLGTIQTNFGNIYLIGKRVMNKGTVVAHSGDVSIAAGEKVIIRFEETPLLSIELGQEEAERITNEGTVRAIRSNPYFEAVSGGSQTEKVALIQKDSRIFLASSHITNAGKIEGEQKVHIQGNSLVNTGEILSSEHIQGSLDKMINGGLIEVNNPHQSIQIELVGPYFETASGVIRAPQGQITIQASRIYSSGAHEALQGTIKHLADEIVLPGAKIVAEGGYHQLGKEDSSQVILTSSSILKGVPLDNAALASNVVFVQDELIDPNQGGGNSFGKIVVALPNGNVVVTKPGDDLFGASSGAVYLYNPQTKALLSILTGSQTADLVGNNGIEVLTNGHFVVKSTSWKNGSASGAGAATWANGWTGITGQVSSLNSLIGSTAGDLVGSFVIPLSNGNYVTGTTTWSNGAITRVGAITWGDGAVGVSGLVSPSNSLVGSQALDRVGSGGVKALTNGNYVVGSRFWNNGGITQAGAATWGDGTVGITGPVSSANSLVGSTASDQVGRRITALTNGNFVVSSSTWSDGAISQVGAATWGDGTTMITGVISAANSLIGSTAGDQIGIFEIAALTNGNYVVSSPLWDDGATADVGAVTWGNGATGITGVVSPANSLVGTTSGDSVGGSLGVQPLTNGNYVVTSTAWNNGGANQAGAVTWGDGTVGISGPVTVSNSLVGSQPSDNVGIGGVIPLTNGNYVVISPVWDNGGTVDVGA